MGDLSSQGQVWLMKAAMSGNAFRLPEKIEPGKFEQTISLWYTCLCGNMKSSQVKAMRNFQFLWRRDDEKIASRPNRGIAVNFKQLQFLMSSGRIDRSDFPSISLEEWSEVEDLVGDLVYETIPAVHQDGDSTKDIITQAVAQTKATVLKTVDAIINGVTNSYYADENTEVGATAKAYFGGADKAIEAMEVVYSNMELYLPYAIVPSFQFGNYNNYDSLMSALRRYYGEDECQQSMVDVIRKIVKLVKKEQRMEQKIAEFREIAHQFMIVDKKDWIKPRDFSDDRTAFMEAAENYGPFTVTMLLAMVFSHNIPENRWDSIQTLFSARCTDISYKGWHENRPELYKILDAEKKVPRAISGVQDSETIAYANKSGWKKNAKKNNRNSQTSKKPKKSNNSGNRQTSNGGSNSKTADRMCRTCSQNAGKLIYHDPPYGGGKNCRYGKNGKNGKTRQSRRLNNVKEDESAEGGDSPTADQESGSDGDDANNDNYDYDSDLGALDEDFYPSFGGGLGANI